MSSPSTSSSNENTSDSGYGNSLIPNTKITASTIVLIFILGFLIFGVHLLAKWVHGHLSRRDRRRRLRDAITIAHHEDYLRQPTSGGLDKSAISQLPSFTYKSGVIPAAECAVCLADFEDDEQGRLLPSCKHSFHLDCVDMWLFTHSTCPLCRTAVVIDDVAMSPESAPGAADAAAPDASACPEHTITIVTEQPPESSSSSSAVDTAKPQQSRSARRILSIQIPSRPDPADLILKAPSPGACLSLPPGLCRRASPSPAAGALPPPLLLPVSLLDGC